MKFLTKVVVLSIAVCILYAIAVIILNCFGIEVSDTLTQYFFTFFGVEMGASAFIRIGDYVINKQKIADKIKNIKDEGLPVEKTDLTTEDKTYYESEGEVYYG